MRKKYLWLTDLHLKFFGRYKLLNVILDQKPKGVFLTGDISEGFSFLSDLEFLGKKVGRPIYFVHGNHELWGSSFIEIQNGISELCQKHPNLIWMSNSGTHSLNKRTAIIGTEGWYDCRAGNENYIKYTFDWMLIKDFNRLPSMSARIDKMRAIADESAFYIEQQLESALDKHSIVYVLSHVPAWVEAHRAKGWLSDKFYEPYNTNTVMGKTIERVMKRHPKKRAICLMGHTHTPVTIHVSNNIECRVGRGSYGRISTEEIFYI